MATGFSYDFSSTPASTSVSASSFSLQSSTSAPFTGFSSTPAFFSSSPSSTPSLFGTTPASSPFGPTSSSTHASSSLFGTAASSPFGATASSSPASGSLFGTAASTTHASSPFGATASGSSAPSPLFGAAASSSPAPSLFGATAASSTPASSSLFGAATASTTPTTPASSSPFGATTASTTPASSPLFGFGASSSAPSGGNTGAFSLNTYSSSSTTSTTTSTRNAPLFGSTPAASLFGSSTPSSSPLFSSAPAPSVFGSATAVSTSSITTTTVTQSFSASPLFGTSTSSSASSPASSSPSFKSGIMAANDQVKMDAICRMESHTKIYHVKIEGYSLVKHMVGSEIEVGTFDLAGFCWAIDFHPSGGKNYSTGRWNSEYICLYLKLLSKITTTIDIQLEFSLIDPNGSSSPVATKSTYGIKEGNSVGFSEFMKKDALEASEYLKDDCLTVRCNLRVIKPFRVDAMRKKVVVPSSDIHQHFGGLVESGEGADITFKINEEIIPAHKYVLAARSPVFKAQFFGPMMESTMDTLKIEDMRADVFKVMLQFIYTDVLPTEMVSDEMAQHLLVAADKYGLERLEVICEKKLCDCLDVAMAASTLVLAEQHHCRQLKDVCIDFVASRDVLETVMETDGFKHLMSCSPYLLKEILVKVHNRKI